MTMRNWSATDLVNKWGRELPRDVQGSLPWELLETLVNKLSEDTMLPTDVLLECIRTRDVSGLYSIAGSFDVTKYTSADLLLQDRLVVDLFKKYDFPNSPFNKKEKAMIRFFEAEEMCREANFRISRGIDLSNDVNAVIHGAIRHIDKVLGRFDLNRMLRSARFGPGSTLCVKGKLTTEYFKYSEASPTVTRDAFPYAEALVQYDHQWKAYLLGVCPFDVVGPFEPLDGLGVAFSITDYNKVTFAPKNAETLRSIAIEPYWCIFFQLGIGAMIRECLLHFGIDLNSQLRNQALARQGSIDGKVTTVDFTMASDTNAREGVRTLIRPDWFEHLDRLRTKNYLMDGVIRPYHKFSSMGNGFTFELESLIFYAIAYASCDVLGLPVDDVSVFGDDVALPTPAYDLFKRATSYLGFKVNEKKSFSEGFFRESCGEDFLKGHRVRPVYCKELRTTQHVASLANRLLELNRSVGYGSRVNDMLSVAHSLLLTRIPRDVRKHVVGPPSENVDGYIHTESLEVLNGSELVRWDRRLFCWRCPVIRFTPTKIQRRDDAVALYVIKGLSAEKHLRPQRVEPRYLSALMRRHSGFALNSFINENVAREITGRKLGRLTLGVNLVWSLGC